MRVMNKLLIGGLVVAGALYYFADSNGVMRHSSGFGSSGGTGISSYTGAGRSAAQGIGSAAGGILN